MLGESKIIFSILGMLQTFTTNTALWEKLKNEQNPEDIIIVTRTSQKGSTKEAGRIWGLKKKKNAGRGRTILQVRAAHKQGKEENQQDRFRGQKAARFDLTTKEGTGRM